MDRGDVAALAVSLWPDAYAAHHGETVDELIARADELAEIERVAARYLAALDGRLGPLDYSSPAQELARLRELLTGSHGQPRAHALGRSARASPTSYQIVTTR